MGKTASFVITKVPVETGIWRGFGYGTHGLLPTVPPYAPSVSLLLLRVISS